MVLDTSGRLREDVSPGALPGYLADENALAWCDVYSTQGGQHGPYRALLREVFGFDELTAGDCFTRSHLPKVDTYDDYLFVAIFSFHPSGKTRRVQTVEVDTYVGETYVECVHPRPLRELDRVRRTLVSGDRFVASSPDNVAHTVFDAMVDEYLPIMNRLSAMVGGIEEALLSDEANDEPEDVLGTLFHVKHELTALRRLAVPLREVVAVLMRPTTRLVPEESRMHYDDVRDQLIRVVDMIDTMRDYPAGSLDVYTSQQTQRINQSLQPLTAISTVILPLTFITNVYWMNFQNMPELTTRYGYFVVLAALAALGALMLYYLHRRKML